MRLYVFHIKVWLETLVVLKFFKIIIRLINIEGRVYSIVINRFRSALGSNTNKKLLIAELMYLKVPIYKPIYYMYSILDTNYSVFEMI